MLVQAKIHSWNFLKPIEEISKEQQNICLTCFYTSARKKDGTYFQKLIDEVHKNRNRSFPLLAVAQQTNGWKKSIIRGWEFNKTVIPLALVGYEIGNSQLDATQPASRASASRVGVTHLVGYLPSHIQRGLME